MFLFLGDFFYTPFAVLKDQLSVALSLRCIIQQLTIRIRNWVSHEKLSLPVKIDDLV